MMDTDALDKILEIFDKYYGFDDHISSDELTMLALSQLAALKARIAELEYMQNLLAVIHRDGGHYVSKHGVEVATKDAITIYYGMQIKIAELEAERPKEKE